MKSDRIFECGMCNYRFKSRNFVNPVECPKCNNLVDVPNSSNIIHKIRNNPLNTVTPKPVIKKEVESSPKSPSAPALIKKPNTLESENSIKVEQTASKETEKTASAPTLKKQEQEEKMPEETLEIPEPEPEEKKEAEEKEKNLCPSCNGEVEEIQKFCPNCATELEWEE